MNDEHRGEVNIAQESDILTVRKTLREVASRLGFGNTDVTRIITSASELARNVFTYAGKGTMTWRKVERDNKVGIEFSFEDKGPGIAEIEQAMQEGYSSKGGLGLGLPGSKRLMDEMEVRSEEGQGTTVTVRKWLRN